MNKKQMNNAINQKLGYELIPAWENFTYTELKRIYRDIVINDCVVVYDGNHVYITPCNYIK